MKSIKGLSFTGGAGAAFFLAIMAAAAFSCGGGGGNTKPKEQFGFLTVTISGLSGGKTLQVEVYRAGSLLKSYSSDRDGESVQTASLEVTVGELDLVAAKNIDAGGAALQTGTTNKNEAGNKIVIADHIETKAAIVVTAGTDGDEESDENETEPQEDELEEQELEAEDSENDIDESADELDAVDNIDGDEETIEEDETQAEEENEDEIADDSEPSEEDEEMMDDAEPEIDEDAADEVEPAEETEPEYDAEAEEEELAPCDDGNPCTIDSYSDILGKCVHEPAAENSVCEDGNKCTENDRCDDAGHCIGGNAKDCSSGNPCMVDFCVPLNGCEHAPKSGTCDDGNRCTKNDRCDITGKCVGVVETCDDGNDCTADSCDPVKGCQHEAKSAANCDDGVFCTVGDTCGAGVCSGLTRLCDPLQCEDRFCNEYMKGCDGTPKPNGVGCSLKSDASNDGKCSFGVCHSFANECPGRADMVRIGSTNSCIDRYEATAADKQTCQGVLYGQASADYPAGFPANVGNGGIQTQKVYACSLPGVIPSRFITWHQAKQACENSGKRLCSKTVWQQICKGSAASKYPYGAAYSPQTCNGADYVDYEQNGTNKVRKTSLASACSNDLGGHDFSGNVAEWINSSQNGLPLTMGGSAKDPAAGLSCESDNPFEASTADEFIGFRCCFDFDPGNVDCDDLNPCTEDSYDNGACKHVALNGNSCSSNPYCMADEKCVSGVCIGTAVNCDDGNPGTQDYCDPSNGCRHVPVSLSCNDGNPCTINDRYIEGVCSGDRLDCDDRNPCTDDKCDLTTGCVHTNNSILCDDGNYCTEGDTCNGGQCVGTIKSCSDGNFCTDDFCDAFTGTCQRWDHTRACDDGNKCTAPDRCSSGSCIGPAAECAIDNPCLVGYCDPAKGCVSFYANGISCNDKDPCTKNDKCLNGACSGVAINIDDNNPCTTDYCDAVNGVVHIPNTNEPCDDGNKCTTNDKCDAKGFCVGEVAICASDNPCVTSSCNPASGCVVTPIAASMACVPSDLCALEGACSNGDCVGSGTKNCDDLNDCTADSCDSSKGCVNEGVANKTCDDGNACTKNDKCDAKGVCRGDDSSCDDYDPCTVDSCAPDGTCNHLIALGKPCDDLNSCTINDVCSAQGCKGTAMNCDDGNDCTADSCEAGICKNAKLNLTACSDNNLCTLNDACIDGACYGTPKDCSAQSGECSFGACEAQTGTCYPLDKPLASTCSGGVCVGSNCDPASDCPGHPEMTLVSGNVCVDRYESALKLNKECTAKTYGQNSKDYPESFPALNTSQSQTTPLYACPGGGELPSRYLTWHQAKAACENSGKRLCSAGEWQLSCGGPTAKKYPYGNTYNGSYCNGADYSPTADAPIKGGEDENCATAKKVYDLTGNVAEWLADDKAEGRKAYSSSAYDSGSAFMECSTLSEADPAFASARIGLRCCLTVDNMADCDDKNPCTDDSFDGSKCVHTAKSGVSCEDGNLCTTGDVCNNGVCKSVSYKNCDDGIFCTEDYCDPAVGCAHLTSDLNCDDGNSCTADACLEGIGCANTPLTGGVCEDGNKCSASKTCVAGECVGTPINCDDGAACTNDFCDPLAGCKHQNLQSGAPCSIADKCVTAGMCDSAGKCVGTPVNCDDNNPCTADSCNPATGCVNAALTGTDCSDANLCSTNKKCQSGLCVGTPIACDDGNPCTDEYCDSASGCKYSNNSRPCSLGGKCSVGDYCSEGECKAGSAVNCDDGNPCTQDFCDNELGCRHVNFEGTCDDSNKCTNNDRCQEGVCKGDAQTCDDSKECTIDYCDPKVGCIYAPRTGTCNDRNACTSGDVCQTDGSCKGSAIDCDDGNPCTSHYCDPQAGCVYQPISGTCDDHNPCTINDVCQNGACLGTAKPCADNNICTSDWCDSSSGSCEHDPISGLACDDYNACTVNDKCDKGLCVGAQKICPDDGNVCTDETCDPVLGCVTTNNSASCDDGKFCADSDKCVGGVCLGTPKVCGINTECVSYYCDEINRKCASQAAANGTICKLPDQSNGACVDGVCAPTSNACPGRAEMLLASSFNTCVDRWEASVFATAGCSGTNYGAATDDYPAGFPDNVGDGGGVQTTPVYACSLPGLIPSRFITWYQAKKACENVGKRLCSIYEWKESCGTADGSLYPYGSVYSPGKCVDNAYDAIPGYQAGSDTAHTAGEAAGCTNSWGGYDFSGNVREWNFTQNGPATYHACMGGSYASTDLSALSCQSSSYCDGSKAYEDIGFRCCLDVSSIDGDIDAETEIETEAEIEIEAEEFELPTSCSTDNDCPGPYYCMFERCLLGCTSDAGCNPGYVCGAHGRCVIPEYDEELEPEYDAEMDEEYEEEYEEEEEEELEEEEEPEPEIDSYCANDDSCNPGWYCHPTGHYCTYDCTSDNQCPSGYYCQIERGKCVMSPELDEELSDVEEEPQCVNDSQCPIGTYCKNYVCDYDCDAFIACPTGKYCNTNRGRCEWIESEEEETGCVYDTDCGYGYYCYNHMCVFECANDSQCSSGYHCDEERGRCVQDTTTCVSDAECGWGRYCDDSSKTCVVGCSSSSDCPSGYYCDPSHGRCYFDSDGDLSEIETEEEVIYCSIDANCPSYYYCSTAGVCASDCGPVLGPCQDGYECTNRGKCVAIEYDEEEEEEVDTYCGPEPHLKQSCSSVSDCMLNGLPHVIKSSNGCECQAVNTTETATSYTMYSLISGVCQVNPGVCDNTSCTLNAQVACTNNVCVYSSDCYGVRYGCLQTSDCSSLYGLTYHHCSPAPGCGVCQSECYKIGSVSYGCVSPKYCSDDGFCVDPPEGDGDSGPVQ